MSPENEPKEPVEPASAPVPEDQLISAKTLNVGTTHRPDETIGADNDNVRPFQGIEERPKGVPYYAGTNIKVEEADLEDFRHAWNREAGALHSVEWRETA